MGDAVLDELIAGNDLDELIREVDRRSDREDWDGLVRLRDRSRAALERGLQLWPAASLAEYRLALLAPASFAGAVVVEGGGHFALGPLAEVAASRHTWDELAPHVPPGPLRSVVAHERVVRGEDLTAEHSVDPDVLGIPSAVEEWEPIYPVAEYRPDRAAFPTPPVPAMSSTSIASTSSGRRTGSVVDALRSLVGQWAASSNGHVDAVEVEGSAAAAIAALGETRVRCGGAGAALAMAWMAWAAASGGAYGRRRGMAAGRSGAWFAAGELAGADPEDPAALGAAVRELSWTLWAPDPAPSCGWSLHLAVEDPAHGLAWAVAATDSR